jgi:acetyl esterase/lipase
MHVFRTALLAASFVVAGPVAAAAVSSADRHGPISIDLWPDGPPGGDGGPHGPERVYRSGSHAGAVSDISVPRIEIDRPAHPNGTAIIVIGGGGYARIGMGQEVMPTAAWLETQGITPVVLYYRLPADHWPAVAPFQDAQRAIRVLRAHAREFGIDPSRIGVLGFSAGGNLAGIAETRWAATFYPAVDATDQLSARPDFAALLYPVISLQQPYDTTRSGRELATQADSVQAYSVQQHVTHRTPPTFLAQSKDDPIANIGNSQIMYDALKKNGVESELHVFQTGGHGWGMGKPGSEVAAWPALFAAWARRNGFL